MKTLREAREERGIKQIAVAKHLKIARQTYAKYEDNPREMPVYLAEGACEFIGCTPSDIFFGTVSSKTEHKTVA